MSMTEAPTAPIASATVPPKWILDFFRQIDAKQFDPPFADFLTEDAHMRFGVHDICGRDEIVATLTKFDKDIDTAHRVLEYFGLRAGQDPARRSDHDQA